MYECVCVCVCACLRVCLLCNVSTDNKKVAASLQIELRKKVKKKERKLNEERIHCACKGITDLNIYYLYV